MMFETWLLIFMFVGAFSSILAGVRIISVLLFMPLLTAAIGVGLNAFDVVLLYAIPERLFGILNNQILYAVPLFVLLGKLLEHSGLAEQMLLSLAGLSKNKGRGLALAVLGTCVIIASATGIIGATITMLTAIALPALVRSGVSEKLSAGLICAAGSLGQIIPPSIVLILLSDQISNAWILSQREAGNFSPEPISVAHLFSAALLPGLLLAALYAIYVFAKTKKTKIGNDMDLDQVSDDFSAQSVLILGLIIAVPASILFGVATASEAASIGVIGVASLMWFSSTLTQFKKAIQESLELIGVIFGIIMAASVLALIFRGLGGDEKITSLLTFLPGESMGALALVMLVIFILGFIIEFIEITYIVIPITAPVLFALGVDPIWFAVLVALNLQISFLTPPLGIALFYFQSVSSMNALSLYRAILPFIGLQIFALLIVYIFPKLATWLPALLI